MLGDEPYLYPAITEAGRMSGYPWKKFNYGREMLH
jgi:hypothetical protein